MMNASKGKTTRGEWQPIETAPQDGTELIGYRPDQGVFTFRWAWMEEFVPKDQNGDPTEDYDDTFAWWWHDRWGWMEGELTPTHWMPLPAEPQPLATRGFTSEVDVVESLGFVARVTSITDGAA